MYLASASEGLARVSKAFETVVSPKSSTVKASEVLKLGFSLVFITVSVIEFSEDSLIPDQ